MSQFSEEEASVAKHYDDSAFDYECARLPRDCPVEMGVTLRWLKRVAKPGDVVVEIGVGGGHYTEFLARLGCRLHLVDVTARLLDAVTARLRQAGLGDRIDGCHHVSGTYLEGLVSQSADIVLLMGPLYHLRSLDDRRRAVLESARILKRGSTLFAAGINRLSYLRDLLRLKFGSITERVAFHEQYLRDGNLDPEHAPPIGYAHLTTIAEFGELFENGFEKLAMLGTESFTMSWQDDWKSKSPEDQAFWLDIVEATGTTVEGMAYSDHFL